MYLKKNEIDIEYCKYWMYQFPNKKGVYSYVVYDKLVSLYFFMIKRQVRAAGVNWENVGLLSKNICIQTIY